MFSVAPAMQKAYVVIGGYYDMKWSTLLSSTRVLVSNASKHVSMNESTIYAQTAHHLPRLMCLKTGTEKWEQDVLR